LFILFKGIILNLSIVFATYHNEEILEKSLEAYCLIETKYQWELIIVDNAEREETRRIINAFQSKLPIHFIEKSEPGKNNALNKALPFIKGKLVMFTDNDIIPHKNLVDEYVNAANNYPEYEIFGGKILPDIILPEWIDTSNASIRGAFGILDLGDKDVEVDPVASIWGGNMMLRKEIFNQGFTFNDSIGPKGANYVMGSESELLARLKDSGYKAMYVAKAVVKHQIRQEQLSISWLIKRSLRAGKGLGYQQEYTEIKKVLGYPRYLVKVLFKDCMCVVKSLFSGKKLIICNAMMTLYHTAGLLNQSKTLDKK
jgi:glycosyltransferase involved in cell wall biosynthesis